MLMYGNPQATNLNFSGKGVVYNLTSMKENFINLSLLLPPNSIGRFTDRDFDIVYANYIMNNDMVFVEFFQIIYNLYIGNDVFIIADEADWSENILESLLKLIQQRYGYNAVMVNSDQDYIYAKNNLFTDFAPGYGLYNLDIDKERFNNIIVTAKLNNNNKYYYLEGFDLNGRE